MTKFGFKSSVSSNGKSAGPIPIENFKCIRDNGERITNKKNKKIYVPTEDRVNALTIFLEWNPQNQEEDMTTEKIRN